MSKNRVKKKIKDGKLKILEVFKYFVITLLVLISIVHSSKLTLSLFSTTHSSRGSIFLDATKLRNRSCTGPHIDDYIKNDMPDITNALEWCRQSERTYSVDVGISWGFLPHEKQKTWDKFKCNEVLKLGRSLSCNDRHGWNFFIDWISKKRSIVTGYSNITCATNLNINTVCKLNNVILDFSKLDVSRDRRQRKFSDGFLSFHGHVHERGPFPDIPGRHHSRDEDIMKCDAYENRPTFVVSNDDIYNLGHYYNDLMGIWANVVFFGKVTDESLLINIDGIRRGGPGGSLSNRVMVKGRPDEHGPYFAFYKSWFNEVKKGIDYKFSSVCFKELYFMPKPGVAWFWNDWGVENTCAKSAASPIYQSFNLFIREKWVEKYGKLPLPGKDGKLHIVIEARHIDYSKGNNHATSRHIKNLDRLIEILSSIDGVNVTAQNFAKISFDKQVALAHSASIFISMHGAGTTHIFHSAIGEKNCCAFIELQPDPTIGFQSAWGYANIARMLGMHYYRYEAAIGLTSEDGTVVDVNIIKQLVQSAIADIKKTKNDAVCLHDIRDTRKPLFQF